MTRLELLLEFRDGSLELIARKDFPGECKGGEGIQWIEEMIVKQGFLVGVPPGVKGWMVRHVQL